MQQAGEYTSNADVSKSSMNMISQGCLDSNPSACISGPRKLQAQTKRRSISVGTVRAQTKRISSANQSFHSFLEL